MKYKENKSKLLMICPIFPPQPGGPATYSELISEKLTEFFEITLIASYPEKTQYSEKKFLFKTIFFRGLNILRPFQFLFYSIPHILKSNTVFITCSIQDTILIAFISFLFRKKVLFRVGGEYHKEFITNKKEHAVQDSIKSYLTYLVLIISHLFVSRYVCVSGTMKKYMYSLGMRKKLFVLQNPAPDIKKSKKHLQDKAGEKIRVLSAGRLIARKRFDELIKLTAFHKDLILTIAGSGPEEKYLKKLTSEYNVRDRVMFAGNFHQNDLLSEFNSNDFFILNSDSGEGSPNIILECLKYGLPVLGSRHIKETGVLNNTNGYIYKDLNDAYLYIKSNYSVEKYHSLLKKTDILKKNRTDYHIKVLRYLLS